MASYRLLCVLLMSTVLFAGLIGSLEANQLNVGGKDGWVLNPSENYNHWSQRLRFQVNDTLFFKYKKGSNSVYVVSKEDYDQCNTQKPIMKMEDGDSVLKLDRSGPLYIISGDKANCDKGQKLVVVVLSLKHHQLKSHPPSPSPMAASPAPVGQTPSPSPKSPSPSLSTPSPSPVSNHPVMSPSPMTIAPVPSPTPASSHLSPSPAPVVSPSPAITPVSPTPAKTPAMSPAPTASTPASSPPAPSMPITPSPSSTALSPSAPGSSPAGINSTAPAPSGSSALAVTPSVVLVTLVLSVFCLGSFVAAP